MDASPGSGRAVGQVDDRFEYDRQRQLEERVSLEEASAALARLGGEMDALSARATALGRS